MRLIKTQRFPSIFDVSSNYIGNIYIADIFSDDQDNEEIYIYLHNEHDSRTLSPAERWIKDDKFAHEIQKNINNIKIDYGIDAVYMVCAKDELKDVLAEIERHINNQHW